MNLNRYKLILVFFLLLHSTQARAQGSLPSGWSDGDVGTAGSASYSNGVFTVNGAGNGIAGGSDGFNFLYQALSGDATIVARVTSSTSYAQAGITIRSNLNANSTHVFLYPSTPAPSYLYVLDRATSPGGTAYPSYDAYSSLPYWIKLVRSGSAFTEYVAIDGLNWVQLGSSLTISIGTNAYIGLAVSSENNPSLASATFDNVSINSAASPAPEITSVSATTGTVGSQ